jgi:hypothetical protein
MYFSNVTLRPCDDVQNNMATKRRGHNVLIFQTHIRDSPPPAELNIKWSSTAARQYASLCFTGLPLLLVHLFVLNFTAVLRMAVGEH